MFLALRELRHAKVRFLLICSITVLLALLVFLLSGLANGLATDNAAAIQTLRADYIAFQPQTRQSFNRSLVPSETVTHIRSVAGVQDATRLGQAITTIQTASGAKIDVAVFGIDMHSFLVPPLSDGSLPEGDSIIVNDSLKQDSIALGDWLIDSASGMKLMVTGITSGQTYSHLPVIFMDIARWQKLRFAIPTQKDGILDPVSVIAIRASTDAFVQLKAMPDIDVVSRDTAVQSVPGYSEETGTLFLIQVFLIAIAAIIIAAFFYVLTLQKIGQFGLLKALGASTAFLVQALLGQILVLTIAGICIGGGLTYAIAVIIPRNVPFALNTLTVLGYAIALVAVAFLGAGLSLRSVITTDPLIAIGRVD